MKFSYHVHSKWSDGRDSIDEIVRYAEKLGLDEVGISDHYSLLASDTFSMHRSSLDAYIEDVRRYQKEAIPVRLGLEADFSLETEKELASILSVRSFDYVLGSVHSVDGIFVDNVDDACFIEENLAFYWKKYWFLVKKMAQSGLFDIVAHLDLPKKYVGNGSKEITSEMEEALGAIRDAGMSVELNTSGWYFPSREQYPSIVLLKRCFELGVSVLVSADAHRKEDLIRDFGKGYQVLNDLGFTKLASYKNREKFLVDIPKPF
ncbi:MAG: histidinol-phosphatase HisJ family protein [Chlamydiota bacterium]